MNFEITNFACLKKFVGLAIMNSFVIFLQNKIEMCIEGWNVLLPSYFGNLDDFSNRSRGNLKGR